jgi:phosphoribosylanthranilate isomerase
MSVRIKLCGFTRAEDVADAVALGVDAIGFNLARGPRRITLPHAIALARQVPSLTTSVALFADESEQTMIDAMQRMRCNVVQLHGNEPPALAERLRRNFLVIKAFPVRNAESLTAMTGYPADVFLLDTAGTTDVKDQRAFGGTGLTWDHALLASVRLAAPIILAGGLTVGNVTGLIREHRPYAVDSASGVESSPGIKDAALMRSFVAACRGRSPAASPLCPLPWPGQHPA